MPPQASHLCSILLVIFAVMIALALVVLAYMWYRNRTRDEGEEIAAARAAQRKRRAKSRLEGPYLSSVRAFYRSLLEAAAKRGGAYARRAAETPTEYARRLHGVLPAEDVVASSAAQTPAPTVILDELTGAYLTERYSGQPASDAQRSRLRSWLPRLLAVFKPQHKDA